MSTDDRLPKVFLTHASEDNDRFAKEFATRLQHSGFQVWFDQWELLPGDSLVDRVFDEGIKDADAMVVITFASLRSVARSERSPESAQADPDRIWDQWVAWLGEGPGGPSIWDAVVEMMASRQIWDGFAVVYNNAPEVVLSNGTFPSWIKQNYIGAQAMAIRRQLDTKHADVVSLARLIQDVSRNAQVLSRDRYSARTNAGELADEFFDQMVGPGLDHIDRNAARADLAKLKTRTRKLRDWATNEVAHYNEAKGTFGVGLTLGDIHAAVDLIVDLSIRYRELILGATMSRSVAMLWWQRALEVAWIPPDQRQEIVQKIRVLELKRERGAPIVDADFFLGRRASRRARRLGRGRSWTETEPT